MEKITFEIIYSQDRKVNCTVLKVKEAVCSPVFVSGEESWTRCFVHRGKTDFFFFNIPIS